MDYYEEFLHNYIKEKQKAKVPMPDFPEPPKETAFAVIDCVEPLEYKGEVYGTKVINSTK
jgi:hypothetical protein